jgi:hypothetical protein
VIVEHTHRSAFGARDMMAFVFDAALSQMCPNDAVKCSLATHFGVWFDRRTGHLSLVLFKHLDELTVIIVVNFQEAVRIGAVLNVIDEQIVKLLVGEL